MRLTIASLAGLVLLASSTLAQDSHSEDNYRRLFDEGLTALRANDVDVAVHRFRSAHHLRPFRSEPPYNLACCYARLGHITEAIRFIDRALRNGYRNEDHLAADADLDAIRSDPRFHELVGRFFGRVAQERAGERKPAKTSKQQLGDGLEALAEGKLGDAKRLLKSSARLSPKDPEPCLAMARLCTQEGDVVQVVRWLEKAIDRGFSEPQTLIEDSVFAKVRRDPLFVGLLKRHFAAPLTTLTGIPFQLRPLRGKVVVVYIWRSWLDPQPHLDHLSELLTNYGRERMAVVLISAESPSVQKQTLKALEKTMLATQQRTPLLPAPLPTVLETVPSVLIVDANGKLVHTLAGVGSQLNLGVLLEPMLAH